jgi:hypothetical protein
MTVTENLWSFSQLTLRLPLSVPWSYDDFGHNISLWKNIRVFYIETPGYVVWPPTREQLHKFVVAHSGYFGPSMQQFIMRCGYGRELCAVDPAEEDPLEFQQVAGTEWEDRIEGLNDYFLPGVSATSPLRNRRGGIYKIEKDIDGSWVGTGGEMPTDYTWPDDYDATFDIGLI